MYPLDNKGNKIKKNSILEIVQNHTGHKFNKKDLVCVDEVINTNIKDTSNTNLNIPHSSYLLLCSNASGEYYLCPTDVKLKHE